MLFKLSYSVERFTVNSGYSLKLKLKGEEKVTILLRSPNGEEQLKGHNIFDAIFDVTGDFEPSKNSLPVFNALIDGKHPTEGEKAKSAEEMIHRAGPSVSLKYYPDPFITFVDDIRTKLSSTGRKVIDILRWRYRVEGPPSPLKYLSLGGLSCSYNNGISWHLIPGSHSIYGLTRMWSGFELREEEHDELLDLIEANSREPLGHELLREAKELQFSSPRSAVLIAVSALEVAIKSIIIEKAPEAEWLIENLQSPPVVTILIKYFPILFKDEIKFYEPKKEDKIIKVICDAVTLRNELAHKGKQPPSDEKVAEIIKTIQKLLWVCDYYSGHKWVEAYIRPSST